MQPRRNKLLTLLFLAAMTVSAGENRASALVTPAPLPAARRPAGAKAITGDPAQLLNCYRACEAGGQTLTNFCSSIDPRLRAACHAL